MKLLHTIVVALEMLSIAAPPISWLDEDDRQGPPVVKPAVLMIDDAAMESIGQRSKIVVTVHSPSSFRCPPCEAMKRSAKDGGWESGDTEIELRWSTGDVYGATAYPWIVSGQKVKVGSTDLAGIRKWLGTEERVQAMQAVAVGSIRGRDVVDAVLSRVSVGDGSSVIRFGSATISVPAKMDQIVQLSGDGLRVSFVGEKPRVSYGSGWLKIGRSVSFLDVSRDSLTVGVDGFPDLKLRID